MNSEAKSTAYKDAGVDIDAGAQAVDAIKQDVESTYTPEVVGSIGGFGGLFSAAAFKDLEDPLLVSGTDGVGTKLELAKRSGRFTTVGIDLVAMCANDIICCGARPLFFLDYIAVGKLDPVITASLVKGVAAGCRDADCALIGGEMAEHPGTMSADDFDMSGFCVGVVDRPKMIGPSLVQEGDAIIGLASSGFHSNGFSLIRKVLTDKLSDEELLSTKLDTGQPLIDALLEPTLLYVKPLLSALEAGLAISAAANITGGGITFNLDRALPLGLDAKVQMGSWVVPPVIQHLVEVAGLGPDDQLQTFNMGIGFAVVCRQEAADAVLEYFDPYDATLIGTVVKAASPDAPGKVVYTGSDAQ